MQLLRCPQKQFLHFPALIAPSSVKTADAAVWAPLHKLGMHACAKLHELSKAGQHVRQLP